MPLSSFKPDNYNALLDEKAERVQQLFAPLLAQNNQPNEQTVPFNVFESPTSAFRCRAEFRFWHNDDDSFYAMFEQGKNDIPIRMDTFPIAHKHIQTLMPLCKAAVVDHEILRHKLFQVEFLTTLSNQNLVTLIYHKRLDEQWQQEAEQLQILLNQQLNDIFGTEKQAIVKIIGRSRKQKITLVDDHVDECLNVDGLQLHYRQIEGSFTQPNAIVNQHMLTWARQECVKLNLNQHTDLLELYCGNGNFTAALAPYFNNVLATEISKSSVRAAQHNFIENHIDNVSVCRLSSEEITEALNKTRAFRRLKQQNIDLDSYNFSTVFVDPPRAGLDDRTLELVGRFENIIYVSCNPDTLANNLKVLTRTHAIKSTAMFDQFPYTHHIETAVVLGKIT